MVRRSVMAGLAAFLLAVAAAAPVSADHDGAGVSGDDRGDRVLVEGGDDQPAGGPPLPDDPGSPGTPGTPSVLPCLILVTATGVLPVVSGCLQTCRDAATNLTDLLLDRLDAAGCGPAISIEAIEGEVREMVSHRVPRLRPVRQPASGAALVRLPVVFASGQSGGARTWRDVVAGVVVTTTVTPTWRWQFGDGASLTTDAPGGPWPDTSVSHTYDRPGSHRVMVTTTWDGSFSIDGAGTFPISGSVTQEASLPVRVVPARAVLVPR